MMSRIFLSDDEMPGIVGLTLSTRTHTPPEVKYKYNEKYDKKLLVWMAISAVILQS